MRAWPPQCHLVTEKARLQPSRPRQSGGSVGSVSEEREARARRAQRPSCLMAEVSDRADVIIRDSRDSDLAAEANCCQEPLPTGWTPGKLLLWA